MNQKQKKNKSQKNNLLNTGDDRFFEIDFLRAIAVLMMVWFHFLWDLNFFGFAKISLFEGFWGLFQKATAGTFLFLVGVSLTISFNRKKEAFEKRFFFRSMRVFLLALLITLFSLVFFPAQPIFFGILHLIGVSILLSITFVKRKFLNLAAAFFILFSFLAFDFGSLNVGFLFWLGLARPQAALDFFPVMPWVAAVFFGLLAGNFFYEGAIPRIKLNKPQGKLMDFMAFLGRNSLLIYFVHQPVLFSLVGIASVLI